MQVEWHDYLSVGMDEIDSQHKLLFEKYNAFFESYYAGRGNEEVIRLFSFLENYVATHFSDEEKLQQRIGFPDYQKHRLQHQELTCKVSEFKDRLENEGPNPDLIASAGLLMTGWLIEHISVMDRAIGEFMKKIR